MQNPNDIEGLILEGVLQPAGIDSETGEMLYNFTDKLKDSYPELHREALNLVNNGVMRLWEKGLVDIDLFQEFPIVKLNNKSFDKDLVDSLDQEDLYNLKEIIRICSNQ